MNYVAVINNALVAQGTGRLWRSAFVSMRISVICGHSNWGCAIVYAAYRILCGLGSRNPTFRRLI